jgi:hypothetical protein
MEINWTTELHDQFINWQKYLNSLPPRLTGSENQANFVKWISDEMKKMDYEVTTDIHYLNYWNPNQRSITHKDKNIPLAGYFPYSGLTEPEGITAPLVMGDNNFTTDVKDKIVVFDIPLSHGAIDFAGNLTEHPLLASSNCVNLITKAKEKGALGAIFIWDKMSIELAQNEILPFKNAFLDIPGLWVDQDQKAKLTDLAKKGESITLTLTGSYTEHSETQTIYSIIPGSDPSNKESILITTHTDGPNAIEENGPVALLTIMKWLKDNNIKFKQTLIFVYVSGHFQQEQVGGPGQHKATHRWLKKFPQYWDGKDGHLKAVFGLTLEHLGTLLDYDKDSKLIHTKTPQPNFLYYSDDKFKDYLKSAVAKVKSDDKVFYLDPHVEKAYFGEGSALFHAGIPNIAMCSMSEVLFQEANPNFQPDQYLMYQQIKYSALTILLVAGIIDISDLTLTSKAK